VEQKYKIREEWLLAGIAAIDATIFIPNNRPLPSNLMVSCSFSITGNRLGSDKVTQGSCIDKTMSDSKANDQICISPIVDDSVEVLDTLVHECLHAQVGVAHGHKAPFSRGMKDIGLIDKPTVARAGEEMLVILRKIADELGPYPHSKLDTTGRKKQTTRMVKCECPECGMVVRASRKALENGPPHCWDTEHGPMEIVD